MIVMECRGADLAISLADQLIIGDYYLQVQHSKVQVHVAASCELMNILGNILHMHTSINITHNQAESKFS